MSGNLFFKEKLSVLVLIINCLKVSSNPLSYTSIRSVYDENTRLDQLLNSINSVKKYIPGADIIVLEVSDISPEQQEIIQKECKLILLNTPDIVKYRDGPYKGITEIVTVKYFFSNIDLTNYDLILKLSGRYEITENFNINNTSTEKYYLKSYPGNGMSTVLYGIPKKLYSHYLYALNQILLNDSNHSHGIEYLLYPFLKEYAMNLKEKLGVKGLVSVSGELYDV